MKSQIINQSEAANVMPLQKSSKYELSSLATQLLGHVTDIVGRGETVKVESIPDLFDPAITQLLFHKLISISTEGMGQVTPTPAGYAAMDNRVAIVYGFTPQGTARSYNKTLTTQSPQAANALIEAMMAVGKPYLEQIEKRRIGRFFQLILDIDLLKRVPMDVVKNMYEATKESVLYYLNKDSIAANANKSYQELIFWKENLECQLKKQVEELDGVKLHKSVKLTSDSIINELSIAETGDLTYHVLGLVDADTKMVAATETDLTAGQLHQLLAQIVPMQIHKP